MTKKAIIFHGTGGNPNIAWYPWLAGQLELKGYEVERPHFPGINIEPIKNLLPKVLPNHKFDENTVLIGHSGGAPLILSILENIDVTISQAFLIAGYSTKPNTEEEPVLQENYNWEKIKANVKDIYFINSTNDPYGCDDKQGRAMFDKLGGTQIILNDGHFGSPWQEYDKFELLERLIK
jgi:predicted alpha/beta hydrolase family esterase